MRKTIIVTHCFTERLIAWEDSGEPMKFFIFKEMETNKRGRRTIERWIHQVRSTIERRTGVDRRHVVRDDLNRRSAQDRRI